MSNGLSQFRVRGNLLEFRSGQRLSLQVSS